MNASVVCSRFFSFHLRFSPVLTVCVMIAFPRLILVPCAAQQVERLSLFHEAKRMEFGRLKATRDSIARARNLQITQYIDRETVLYLEEFVHGEPYYLVVNNAVAAKTIRTDSARQNFNLTGQGVLIGLWDFAAVDTAHPEIAGGRVMQMDGAPLDTANDHATHVAGTLAARGLNPLAKGMTSESVIHAYDVRGGDTFRMLYEIGSSDMHLSNHSYGIACGWIKGKWYGNASIHPTIDYKFGYYDVKARDWDSVAVDVPTYLIVKAAGNFRGDGGPIQPPPSGMPQNNGGTTGYDCIPTYGVAKNILTVGAVDGAHDNRMTTFSAWGPTDDGRIKPDIVAHGEAVYSCSYLAPLNKPNGYATNSGTSQAAPGVTGSVALLMQYQQRLHPGLWLLSSTLKALLIHTADDLGNPGPDYSFGWGLMNTERAAELMEQDSKCGPHIFNSALIDETNPVLRRNVQSNGDTLKATICWIDPPAEPLPLDTAVLNNPARRLVNDLDLRIVGPTGTLLPWVLDGPANPASLARTGDNILDNVEQVIIAHPVAGDLYSIEISRKGVLKKRQSVSLLVTGNCTMHGAADPDLIVCDRQPVQIAVSPICGTGPFSYSWTPADSTLDAGDIPRPTVTIPNASGVPVTHTYFVTVTDKKGCTALDSVRVTVRPALVVSAAPGGILCAGDSIRLSGRITGGTPPFKISWSPSTGLDDASRLDPVARPQASTTYVLTVTDSAGCSTLSRPIDILVLAAPAAPVITQSGDSLVSTPGTGYQWHINGTVIPGGTARRIFPVQGGFYTVSIMDTNGCIARSQPFPFGVCTVELSSIEAAPGERVVMTLGLTSSSFLATAGAQSFTASIRMNKNILTPIETTPAGTITDSSRTISVSGPYADGMSDLTQLSFRAMLGDRDISSLLLETFSWNVPNIRTMILDGEFRLRICREGGDRLFSATAPLRLSQNRPNPFNATTVVDFAIIETGPVELAVFDLLGRKVSTLVQDILEGGAHSLVYDASALPSGFYLLSLRASSRQLSRMMQVVK